MSFGVAQQKLREIICGFRSGRTQFIDNKIIRSDSTIFVGFHCVWNVKDDDGNGRQEKKGSPHISVRGDLFYVWTCLRLWLSSIFCVLVWTSGNGHCTLFELRPPMSFCTDGLPHARVRISPGMSTTSSVLAHSPCCHVPAARTEFPIRPDTLRCGSVRSTRASLCAYMRPHWFRSIMWFVLVLAWLACAVPRMECNSCRFDSRKWASCWSCLIEILFNLQPHSASVWSIDVAMCVYYFHQQIHLFHICMQRIRNTIFYGLHSTAAKKERKSFRTAEPFFGSEWPQLCVLCLCAHHRHCTAFLQSGKYAFFKMQSGLCAAIAKTLSFLLNGHRKMLSRVTLRVHFLSVSSTNEFTESTEQQQHKNPLHCTETALQHCDKTPLTDTQQHGCHFFPSNEGFKSLPI